MKCARHIHTVAPYKHRLVRRSSVNGTITLLRETNMCTRCRLHVRQAWRTPLRMLQALNFKRLFALHLDCIFGIKAVDNDPSWVQFDRWVRTGRQ